MLGHREPGVITSVNTDSDYFNTVWVEIAFDAGGHQGFGGLRLDDLQADYVRELCRTFGVEALEDLSGKRCYGLRCWDNRLETLEGIEDATSGNRFVLTAWKRKQGLAVETRLESRRKALLSSHTRALREAAEAMHEVSRASENYIEWADCPSTGCDHNAWGVLLGGQ